MPKWPHRYALYEASVQDSEGEIELYKQFYKDAHRRTPHIFREDFCATFLHCCEWVKTHPKNRAIGIDISAKPLRYGREHHLTKLSADQQRRITLLQENVLTVRPIKADIVSVSNFSFFFIKKRRALLAYLKRAYASLKPKGIFALDLMGGLDVGNMKGERHTFRMPDRRRYTYIWEQTSFDPISNEGMFYIHFKDDKGRYMKKAFTYDWRVWSVPEVREVMEEAGFGTTHVYWEGDDDKGGGNGKFIRVTTEENCDVWIAYVVGVKR